ALDLHVGRDAEVGSPELRVQAHRGRFPHRLVDGLIVESWGPFRKNHITVTVDLASPGQILRIVAHVWPELPRALVAHHRAAPRRPSRDGGRRDTAVATADRVGDLPAVPPPLYDVPRLFGFPVLGRNGKEREQAITGQVEQRETVKRIPVEF